MSQGRLPEELETSTYWEQRCALAETALRKLAETLCAHAHPALAEDIHGWAREWDRLLGEITREQIAKSKATGEQQ